jgi:hypothetical protein
MTPKDQSAAIFQNGKYNQLAVLFGIAQQVIMKHDTLKSYDDCLNDINIR